MRILSQMNERTRRHTQWMAAVAVVSLFGVVAAFGTVQESPLPAPARTIVEALAVAPQAATAEAAVFWHEERVQRGDTISSLLSRVAVDDEQINLVMRAPQATSAFRFLRPGTTLQARTGEAGELQALWFMSPRDKLLMIERDGDTFRSSEREDGFADQILMKSGEIRSSLFAATDAAGLPDSLAMQLAEMFAGDIDFHRDLRRGDSFTVVYEMAFHNGRPIRAGRVLAAEFINQNKAYRAVWFKDVDGQGGYYTPEGKNLRKAFLRSPLEFSRITSGFGMRHHPILKSWRAHKGVDYAAPPGTRVRATSDGFVELAAGQAGYGNLVTLKHHGGYTTHYAHLRGFAPGLRRGARVNQGDTLGFVGQTGWATGPHLHYEFRANNVHRNPLTMAFPAAQPITPDKLATFRTTARPLAARLDLLRNTNLALLE
ncbi:MAG: M23 family peptidase [Betaproteobacteria bacterium]|nr:M23 family peptidase [Betaproteobacteria bacterium]